jgi:hypothetical protein
MLLETRIWQALNILAILVSAFGALYAGFYVPSAFTEKKIESSPPVTAEVAGGLSALGDRIKLSILIDNEPVKNLVLSSTSITNTGSIPIVPTDFYTNLSLNVDKQWKILAVINALPETAHPVWKKINDQQFEASSELLNPSDVITAILFATNTQYEHLTREQVSQLKPEWSTHILNLKYIVKQTNPITKIITDPFKNFPVVVFLFGSALLVTLTSTIFLMAVYINLLYYLDYLKDGRWQSVAAKGSSRCPRLINI